MSPFDEAAEKVKNPQDAVWRNIAKKGSKSESAVLGGGGGASRPPPPKNIIQPWHVVLGDCNSRECRTTEATKVIRAVKREFLKSHFGQRKEEWIPLAVKEFYKRLNEKQFGSGVAPDIGRVLVRCTPKAMGRVEVPFQYGFKDEEEAWYGIAKQREALDFFLASRDSPTLADELIKHQRNFADLEQSEEKPPYSMMESFRELIDYVQNLLHKAEKGDRFSASILDSLSPINKLKIHWKTLNDSKDPKTATEETITKISIDTPLEPDGGNPAIDPRPPSSPNTKHDKCHAAVDTSQPILGLALYPQLRDQAMKINRLPVGRQESRASSEGEISDEEDPVTVKIHSLEKEIGEDNLSFLDEHLIVDDEQVGTLTEPGDPSVFDPNGAEISLSSDNGLSDHSDPSEQLPGRIRDREDDTGSGEETERRLLKRARTARRLAVALSACATFGGVVFGVGVASADSAQSDDSSGIGRTSDYNQIDDDHTISPESTFGNTTPPPMHSETEDGVEIPNGIVRLSLYLCLVCVVFLCFLVIPYWCCTRCSFRDHQFGSSDDDGDDGAGVSSAVAKKEGNRNDENV